MPDIITREPVLTGAAAQAVTLLVCFLLGASTAGTTLAVAAVLAVTSVVVRRKVTPEAAVVPVVNELITQLGNTHSFLERAKADAEAEAPRPLYENYTPAALAPAAWEPVEAPAEQVVS